MKNVIITIFLLAISSQVYAQKEKMISAYYAGNYQLTSSGVGVQFKGNIIDRLYIANNIIVLFNNEHKVNKMVNLDANLQYILPFSNTSLHSFYPLIGVGWANYKTEYFETHYGELDKDIEYPIEGSSIFFNLGVGTTLHFFDRFSINAEYKWATSQGKIHSTWLIGIGFSIY